MTRLFCFGLGYSAAEIARCVLAHGGTVSGTSSSPEGACRIDRQGYAGHVFDGTAASGAIDAELATATHVLVSVPPGESGDRVLPHFSGALARAPQLGWIGYLSTVGVYGDHDGAWVDEATPPRPLSPRSKRRLGAELAWLELGARASKLVQVFRLAAIYGPGRSAVDQVLSGTARRVIKPGQVFNRIHVEDIAAIVLLAMAGRGRHAIYNVADDEPAPPQDVVAYAAEVLGLPLPPEVAFEKAGLSPMAASFYAESKRVRNQLMKSDLGARLKYPTYRQGIRALARR